MNPCPCGFFSDPHKECTCPLQAVQRYRARISGPLLDRIDIHVDVPATSFRSLNDPAPAEASAQIRARVERARQLQLERFQGRQVFGNAQMTTRDLRQHCRLDGIGDKLLEQAMDKLALSARAFARILKVGRTISDLDGSESIEAPHVAEAIQYRSLDRAVG